jgi:hypothetical protein
VNPHILQLNSILIPAANEELSSRYEVHTIVGDLA